MVFTIKNYIKKKYNKKSGYGFYAISDIPKNTIILIDPIAISKNINKQYKSSFDIMFDIIQTICFNNSDIKQKFINLAPQTLDNYIISSNELLNELDKLSYKLLLNMPINDLRLLCAKYMRNAFTFSNTIQASILLNGSIFNHSCIPNISFKPDLNNNMVFTTNKNIIAGEELFISYLQTNKENSNQYRLLHQYGFICNCESCK